MVFHDKMLVLDELAERIMANSSIKDPERAKDIARKWMSIRVG